jgi:hypothetical protein
MRLNPLSIPPKREDLLPPWGKVVKGVKTKRQNIKFKIYVDK